MNVTARQRHRPVRTVDVSTSASVVIMDPGILRSLRLTGKAVWTRQLVRATISSPDVSRAAPGTGAPAWNAGIASGVLDRGFARKQEDAMPGLIPILLSGVLLAASPGTQSDNPAGNDKQQGQQELTDAQAFSIAAGRILGAASACDQIDRARVSTAASKAAALTAAVATDEDELSSAKELMKASAAMGRQAVQDGKADCKVVETSFGKLEAVEQQQPQGDEQPDQQDQ
jgi:hypothetical protein